MDLFLSLTEPKSRLHILEKKCLMRIHILTHLGFLERKTLDLVQGQDNRPYKANS